MFCLAFHDHVDRCQIRLASPKGVAVRVFALIVPTMDARQPKVTRCQGFLPLSSILIGSLFCIADKADNLGIARVPDLPTLSSPHRWRGYSEWVSECHDYFWFLKNEISSRRPPVIHPYICFFPLRIELEGTTHSLKSNKERATQSLCVWCN